jgi:hypothetical protein
MALIFFKYNDRVVHSASIYLQYKKKLQADATKSFSMKEAEKGRANVPLKE